ncbi:MAG: hypothetical protein GX963_06725 [Bacteroidales bacterium]|nr:hypothetical protein [Bacteroidales bacterium]
MYTLIIRTGEAEIRASEYISSDILNDIFPIIEITRGRKRTIDEVAYFPFESRLEKLSKIFKGKKVGIALTNEKLLSSKEIDELNTPDEGYKKWVDFLLELKRRNIFSEIVPVLALYSKDEDFEMNFYLQVEKLQKYFSTIIYRSPIVDEFVYDDLDLITNKLSLGNTQILIDCGYTPQASHKNVAEKVSKRISNLKEMLRHYEKNISYIVASTSFPNNVNDLGGGDTDTYQISSVELHEVVSQIHKDVIYGDYGSINPQRNDGIRMARGWIPRIDVPLEREVFYYRQRRPKGVTAYSTTYVSVAKQVIKDSRFPMNLATKNWGVQQIIDCTKAAPASSPSFWISVRMNIHVEQQVLRMRKMINE